MAMRLSLEAELYTPAPPKKPKGSGRCGRPRVKGAKLPTLEAVAADPNTERTRVPRWYSQGEREVEIVWYRPGLGVPIRWMLIRDPKGQFATQALLCTDLLVDPVQILLWFVQRWQLEVKFQEVRRHLGVETQRQWNDLAIDRTTPALLDLLSLVTPMAQPLIAAHGPCVHQASGYVKKQATFSDTLALARCQLWRETTFEMSAESADISKVDALLLDRMTETLCYAV